jgi:dihydrofolate reductase
MGKIIITENVSLDGVARNPADESLSSWMSLLSDTDRQQWAQILAAEADSAQALLLGRRTDAWFAERWLTRTGPWADRLNSMPKYVVSATIQEPVWTNATLLGGDVVAQAEKLKAEVDGDVVVYGSVQLARTLLEHDLADELRLIVYPVIAGTGERLFGPAGDLRRLALVSTQVVGDSLALLRYQVVMD